jgi:hypothetical protein
MTTNNAKCICKIKSSIAMVKQHSTGRYSLHQKTGLKLKEETSDVLNLEHSIV